MKIFSSILFLLLFNGLAFSQIDFEITLIPAYGDGSATDNDFLAHSMIKNLSDQTIVIAWQRIENDIPEGWESYVCSNVSCAPPDISMGTFSLTAYDSTNLDCHFQPNGQAGMGMVEIKFFLTDDTAQIINATYFGNANPVSTIDLVQDKIKVYPNPASEYIFIDSKQEFILEIYSSSGKHIKTFKNMCRVNINFLLSGTYFFKIYDQNKSLRSINSFQKINTQ